ncbi:MAG TPA: hypothetical protein VKS79_26710 [Gemmataceae bacterium]|nr:hypothetical protein [Gemmataceae bacterium]
MSNDPRRPRRPRQGDPVSDIERFLKEVDRLRKKASDEARPQDRTEEAVPVEPVRRRRVEPPRPVVKPRPRARLQDEPVPVLEVEPVERPVRQVQAVDFTPTPQPPPPPVVAPLPPMPETKFNATAPKAPAVTPPRRVATAAQVRSLLQANNLRTAMVLREILDKPRCKRPPSL